MRWFNDIQYKNNAVYTPLLCFYSVSSVKGVLIEHQVHTMVALCSIHALLALYVQNNKHLEDYKAALINVLCLRFCERGRS